LPADDPVGMLSFVDAARPLRNLNFRRDVFD
jgi:hypothetical protein